MTTEMKPGEKSVLEEPKFRDPATMTYEQLHDPDYHLKQIAKRAGIRAIDMINCSRCHHCR